MRVHIYVYTYYNTHSHTQIVRLRNIFITNEFNGQSNALTFVHDFIFGAMTLEERHMRGEKLANLNILPTMHTYLLIGIMLSVMCGSTLWFVLTCTNARYKTEECTKQADVPVQPHAYPF